MSEEIPQIVIQEVKKKRVSYSQFSNWFNCPHRWYLDNVKGLKVYEDSISTCFGTAIHETIQLYITALYKEGTEIADDHDLMDIFAKTFEKQLTEKKVEISTEQTKEYLNDGQEIIKAFSNITNRIKYFPSNKYELIGIENEIIMPVKNNVDFICFIDVVLKEKNTGKYRIIDIKTSSNGWNQYQKEDPAKYSQVLIYKAFFSKKYNVPMDMIDVEFFILKRKLFTGVAFPQSRIQTFIPVHNQKNVANILGTFSQFISECFNKDGTFIETTESYPKIPGKNKKNCKYCPHKKINCDTKSDVSND
jgi:hypothetical protein